MPRRKVTGDAYADKGRSSVVVTHVHGEAFCDGSDQVDAAEEAARSNPLEALKRLATFDEGWLRVVSHEQGLVTYFKFKFSRGQHAGSYVFYHCTDGDYALALAVLLRKVEKVYLGALRPTPDTPYS